MKMGKIYVLFYDLLVQDGVYTKKYEGFVFGLSNSLGQTLRFVTPIRFPSYHVTHSTPYSTRYTRHITSHHIIDMTG
jgi:hypothetical protein